MRCDASILAIILVSLFVCSSLRVGANDKPQESKFTENHIRELIKGLHADDFKVRNESELELIRIGADAVKLLRQAAQSGEPEVRFRARRVLEIVLSRLRKEDLLNKFESFRGQIITPNNISALKLVGELKEDVWRIVWSPSGQRVAFVHWKDPVRILDGQTFRQIETFDSELGPIHFAFNVRRDIIAYCEDTDLAKIHLVGTGNCIELPVDNNQPRVTFSPDGSLLATGGYGNSVKLWSVADGRLVRTLDLDSKKGGLQPVFSPDGKKIAIGNRNSVTMIFDVATGKRLTTLNKRMTHEIAFSPNGRNLAVTYVDGSLGLSSVSTKEPLLIKTTGAEELYTLVWSPKGDLLLTAGLHGKITVWKPHDLSIIHELDAPEWIISVRFTPDGTRLLAAGGSQTDRNNRRVMMWGIPRDEDSLNR